MDELKLRAGEKFEAIHEAAKTAAGSSKSKVQDVVNQTVEAVKKVREIFHEIWHHELIAESRARISAWWAEAIKRIKEGAPPLSPVLLYEELVALLKDRVWRRSACVFALGLAVGACAGAAVGARLAGGAVSAGPHARALYTHPDHSVILVDDAVTPGLCAGEVLVRVQAFSVCPVDRWVLRGRGAALRALIFRTQLTVGRAFAGVVLDVGHGVSELDLGDEVWGCVSEWSGGAASELLTIRSTRVSKRPQSVSADAAASLPWAGALALQAIDTLRYKPHSCKGKRVAILGAGSGEGCVLLQLLAAWGAALTAAAPRHAALTLKDFGAHEFLDVEEMESGGVWQALARRARGGAGPWHAVLACGGTRGAERPPDTTHLLKATAPRDAVLDLRPRALVSDRLGAPLAAVFAVSFYALRTMRWMFGLGTHTDWLEDKHRLSPGLDMLRQLVEAGTIKPILDKVYMPQDFESALAHACSDDAIGTTVIRFL